MLAGAFAGVCVVFPMLARGAEAPPVARLVGGPAALLRATGRFALAEGVRMHVGDIVEVPDKGLVQIAFACARYEPTVAGLVGEIGGGLRGGRGGGADLQVADPVHPDERLRGLAHPG